MVTQLVNFFGAVNDGALWYLMQFAIGRSQRAPVPVVLFQAVRYELGGVKLPASLKPRVVGLSRSAIGCEKCP